MKIPPQMKACLEVFRDAANVAEAQDALNSIRMGTTNPMERAAIEQTLAFSLNAKFNESLNDFRRIAHGDIMLADTIKKRVESIHERGMDDQYGPVSVRRDGLRSTGVLDAAAEMEARNPAGFRQIVRSVIKMKDSIEKMKLLDSTSSARVSAAEKMQADAMLAAGDGWGDFIQRGINSSGPRGPK